MHTQTHTTICLSVYPSICPLPTPTYQHTSSHTLSSLYPLTSPPTPLDYPYSGTRGSKARKAAALEAKDDVPERSVTVASAGLRTGDVVLLEEGPVPQRGRTKLNVYLWVPDLAAYAKTKNMNPDQFLPPGQTADDPSIINASTSRFARRRRLHLLPLFVGTNALSMKESSALLDLQRMVFHAMQGPKVASALHTVLPGWKGKSIT